MENSRVKEGRLTLLVVLLPLIVSLSKNQSGLVIGWSAVLPNIQMDNSTSLVVTDSDVKWLVSLTGIIGLACNLVTGPLIEFLGPTRFLLWMHIPNTVFWLMSAFAPYISILYLARSGLSIILTWLGPVVPLLVSELSEPKIRGFVLSMDEIIVAVCISIMYVLARELYWVTATALCALPSILMFFALLFLPESPYWLARKGRTKEAKDAIVKLWSSKSEAIEELDTFTENFKKQPQTRIVDQIKLLKHSRNFRPVLLLFTIYALREFGGEYVIFNYTVYIFKEAGVEIDPFTCTIMVGVTRMIFALICSLLMDRVGRRPLLIATSLVCSLSATICGGFLLSNQTGSSWVSLVALLIYVASYGLGLGPIPWGLTGEMIPTPVRSIGGPICMTGYSLSVFIMGYLFPIILDSIGIGFLFLIFSVSLLLLSFILMMWFPETKGKTLNDLQNTFKRKNKNNDEYGKDNLAFVSDISKEGHKVSSKV